MSEAPVAPAPAPAPDASTSTPPVTPPVAEASPLGGTATPAPGETPPAGETPPPAAEEKPAEGEAPAVVYTEFKLPDGVTVDETAMGQFTEFAGKAGLSQENAQAALDLHMSQLAAQAEAFQKSQSEAWTSTIESWKTARAAMPEFSGERAVAAQATIGRALDVYGSQEARDAFDLTGAGHNPAIVKFVHAMAAALDEGNLIPGGGPAPKGPRTPGEVLYGDTSQGT